LQNISCQEIYDFFDIIRNCEEWKEIIQEWIYADYSFDEISDFLNRKFFKFFRSEDKFVVSIVEEEAVFKILNESIKKCAVNITEESTIKRFYINSKLKKKTGVSILDVTGELKQ
jgi:hypothetical protein